MAHRPGHRKRNAADWRRKILLEIDHTATIDGTGAAG